jgi:putative ABC transport system substrate-binding protein
MPKKIGLMHSGRSASHAHDDHIRAFKAGANLAYVGGGGALTFANEQFGEDDPSQLPIIAQALAQDNTVDLIAAMGGSASADAARGKTTVKPIVFTSVSAPNRPALNTTGVCARTSELDRDRLKVLFQLKPNAQKFGALINPDRSNILAVMDALNQTATSMGYPPPNYQTARSGSAANDVTNAFQFWHNNQYAAVIVTADPLFHDRRVDVAGAANNNMMPTIYQWRDFVDNQGLISYGPNLTACYRFAGYYAGEILNGEAVLNLPIITPACELVINLTIAKRINCDIPTQLLNQATDIII